MKYLLALLIMISSSVYAQDDLCDAVAALSYVMAVDYYEHDQLNVYMYSKADSILEVAIIDILVETKPEPLHLAYIMKEICINDTDLVKEAIEL